MVSQVMAGAALAQTHGVEERRAGSGWWWAAEGGRRELGNPGGGGGGRGGIEQVTVLLAQGRGGGLAGGHCSPRGAERVPGLPRTDRTVPKGAAAAHSHLERLARTAAVVIKLVDATTEGGREARDVTPAWSRELPAAVR
ncbi:hypothetical protein E2C01_007209 [Portunus trituberculatus]|uniref:Uncharacterized protein n=1 Tax=Portunus trituberculatus TaxID=210409 RepID=A0A5B7CXJ3_PORTR|nr:hypothetical protein [Portunus trituberculatus]